jgi:uncharacterized lipoprotein YbaY
MVANRGRPDASGIACEVRDMEKALVRGEIRFAELPDLPTSARAYVRLLDTSLADAASRVVAEKVLDDIADAVNSGKTIEFELNAQNLEERNSYTVNVLVDVDGDGKISRGDYLSMQSYPVLTHGYPHELSVQVKRVE